MFVRMRSTYSYQQTNGARRVIPAGWSGDLDDEVARKAIEGGYTSEPKQSAKAEVKPASKTEDKRPPEGNR